MAMEVYVYDPTASDEKSKVRGVGRYLQLLRESFGQTWHFADSPASVPYDSVFVNPFVNVLQPPVSLRRVAKRQVAVIHDLIPIKYPSHFPLGMRGNLTLLLHRFLLDSYDAVVTDSLASKNDISEMLGIPPSRIHVVYPTVPDLFRLPPATPMPLHGIPSSYILYVGDATWNKNLPALAAAVQKTQTHAVCVGKVFALKPGNNAWEREFGAFMRITKENPQFVFPGYVSDEKLKLLYRQAVINVLPSRDEGFGFSYLEAAVLGCPSLLSDIPVFKETAETGAFFVDTGDEMAFGTGLQRILSAQSEREEMKVRALERSKFFSKEAFARGIETVINAISP